MKASVEEVGGTMVLALPADIVDMVQLKAGSSVDVGINEGALVVMPARTGSRYTLEELLDKSDPRAFDRTAEDEEWFNAPPVGRELI